MISVFVLIPEGCVMREEIAPTVRVVTHNDIDDLRLSGRERRLIDNFREMKESARDMLVDLSDQYRRTLPAKRVELRLLRPGD